MKFRIETLVDITETHTRRRNNKQSHQQDNCDTVIQTIGLRVNATNVKVTCVKENCDKKFGSVYKGQQSVWHFDFEPNIEDATNVEALVTDFDSVPIIIGLDESVSFDLPCFYTNNNLLCNIIFSVIE